MKIELNIKGTVTEIQPGKHSLSTYIGSRGFGSIYDNHNDGARRVNNSNDILVYHAEKHRRVVEVLDKPIKLTKKQLQNAFHAPQDGLIKRKIVKKAHWKVTTYIIPYELLKMANLKVIQESRTFKCVKAR